MKSSATGSSFQWNYWPKSLTTRASKLAEELSSDYKLMKSYYHQERDYNPFRWYWFAARMDRLIKRSAISAPHLSTGLTAPRWLSFPDILILHWPFPIYKWGEKERKRLTKGGLITREWTKHKWEIARKNLIDKGANKQGMSCAKELDW